MDNTRDTDTPETPKQPEVGSPPELLRTALVSDTVDKGAESQEIATPDEAASSNSVDDSVNSGANNSANNSTDEKSADVGAGVPKDSRLVAQTALAMARQLILAINNDASWSFSNIDGALPEISRPLALFLIAPETVWQARTGLSTFGQTTAWGFRGATRQVRAVIPARLTERTRLLTAAVTEIHALQTNTKRVPNEERGAFWEVFAGHHVVWPDSVKVAFVATDKMGEAVVAEAIRIAVDEQVLGDDLERLMRGDQTHKGPTTVVAFERSRPQ